MVVKTLVSVLFSNVTLRDLAGGGIWMDEGGLGPVNNVFRGSRPPIVSK